MNSSFSESIDSKPPTLFGDGFNFSTLFPLSCIVSKSIMSFPNTSEHYFSPNLPN